MTYTGGTGPHRADRLILDYAHAARILGLDTSRIMVDTADKALAKKLASLGVLVGNVRMNNGITDIRKDTDENVTFGKGG